MKLSNDVIGRIIRSALNFAQNLLRTQGLGYAQRMLANKYILGVVLVCSVGLVLFFSTERGQQVLDDIAETNPALHEVIRVSDGDTIVVSLNGVEEKIRFIGVDTPERNHESKGKQCYAEEATVYLQNALQGSRVRLEADPLNDNRDRYERLLRHVYREDGLLLNQELIAGGYGFALTSFNHSKLDEFIATETDARTDMRGLWSACEYNLKDGYYQTETIEPFSPG